MAEFQGFLLSVLIIEGVGGMDGWVGGLGWMGRGGWGEWVGGRWQKPPLWTLHEQP